MSNYNNLKTTIDANIKQNGNQEITGPILNSVLNQMVNILGTGYQFAGVATLDPATDPGTPDAKVFYIANGKGTYTNFGGLEVTEDEVVVLYWDTAWHKVATGIASQAKLSELEENIGDISSNNNDSFNVVDNSGNVIATIDADGIKTTNVKVKDSKGEIVDVVNEETYNKYIKPLVDNVILKQNGFHIVDNDGNIAFSISANGEVNYNGKSSSSYKGLLFNKRLYGIGDSLSVLGKYEKALCENTGSIYGGVYSAGGTFSIPNANNSTQDRVKQFISDNPNADVVILENINDGWYAYNGYGASMTKKGSVDDVPFMVSQYFVHENGYLTKESAEVGFTSNFNTIVNGVTNKIKGTICRVKYTTKKIVITISGTATSSGVMNFKLGGNEFNVSITTGMTSAQIASALNEYAFDGYSHSVSGSIVTLTLTSGTIDTPVYSFTASGVSATYSENDADGYVNFYFLGFSATEFTDSSKWSSEVPSLYSLYKGIIEYLQTNKPLLRIVFFHPSTWNGLDYNNKLSSQTNNDGSYNITKIYKSSYDSYFFGRDKLLREIQKEVALYCGIEYFDAMEECGVSPFNVEQYAVRSGDVHPNDSAYQLWAKYLGLKLN